MSGWVRTWGVAPLDAFEPLPTFAGTTARHVVRAPGAGPPHQRVRHRPAPRRRVALAAPGGDRDLTFSGRTSAVVPVGTLPLSDPVDAGVDDLAVSFAPRDGDGPPAEFLASFTGYPALADSADLPLFP